MPGHIVLNFPHVQLPSAMQRMQVRKQNGKEENVLRRDRHIHTQTHATYDDLHLPRVDWLASWLGLAVKYYSTCPERLHAAMRLTMDVWWCV